MAKHDVQPGTGHSENRRGAKFYSLTPAGRRQLAHEVREWQQTAHLIAAFFALKVSP